MSETHENTAAEAAKPAERAMSPQEKIAASFEKKGVALCISGTTPDAFIAFAETFNAPGSKTETGEEVDASTVLYDWSEGVSYDTPSYIIVKADNDENRMIALPSRDVAMNDAVIRSKAYDWYLGKAVLAAKKEDAGAALFKTPAGFFLGFDLEAFKFQEDTWVTWFKEKKGVKNINPRALRLALSSAAYAKSRFPAAPQTLWEKLIGAMSDRAAKAGQNTAIFAHWLATREITEVDLTKIEFSDDELAHVGEAAPATPAQGQAARVIA